MSIALSVCLGAILVVLIDRVLREGFPTVRVVNVGGVDMIEPERQRRRQRQARERQRAGRCNRPSHAHRRAP